MINLLVKYSLLVAVIWTAIIFGLCCMPGQYIPTANWLELLSFDKFVHASIFFGLVCLWLIYLLHAQKLSSRSIVLLLLLSVAYGGLLEIMQATVFSHRSADWFDFIANSVGCLLGYWLFNKYKSKLQPYAS